ncbi:DUF2844 domain-containing protein [Paraburkholderia solisilvae]|uniref:DUF2844 domain-containing protein n=1 Tax=Paraburkholderia solisilvae TaxID=624376 RepID=A0A6J5F179_9BURK|nr:DUF2844 domain-containing protein [Paraburkholderia solisilvae]CAB3772114.1 hypothetical protein LMG29739_06195 [Paraburkholderia solisilvae]
MCNSNQSRRLARARARAAAVAACCAAGLLAAAPSVHAALSDSPMTTPDGATVTTSTPPATAPVATMRNAIASGASGASADVSGASGAAGASGASAAAPYTVRETTLKTGTVVREYISTSTQHVFGVAWNGPFQPRLSNLFGGQYYQQYALGASAAQASRGAARGQLSVQQGGLVVHSGGHMGHFVGAAWLPAELPAGVTGDDIR